jgi:hypothetical protein
VYVHNAAYAFGDLTTAEARPSRACHLGGSGVQNLARLRRDTLPRWHALLAELGRREHLLLEGLMSHVEDGSRYYGGLVDAEDFKESSVEAFRHLLGQLVDGHPPAELADLPRRIGIRRAAQGVPLDSVVSTVREDFNVLWSTLLWVAGVSDMPALISHVDDLWRAVDDFATEIGVSYLRASAARTELDRSRQRAMVSALFSADELAPGLLRQIAGTLGVDEAGPFEVVATDPADREQLDALIAQMRGHQVFVTDVEDVVIAFWAESEEPPLSGLRCGRPPVARRLAEVPARAHAARRILRALPADARGPATMADVWARLAAIHLQEASPEFVAQLRSGLDACPAVERERIVATAREFFDTGSVAATSQNMFCHRNTVLNRLRRLRELTGLDVALPRDAALAVVLLQADRF